MSRHLWHKLKRPLWQWRGILITAPSVTVFVVLLRFAGLLELLEMAAFDQLFQLRPHEAVDSRIVIIEVNESDIQRLGWPISDRKVAQLINIIRKHNPVGIGFDIYRDKPVLDGYDEFVKVVKSTPNLIGVQKVGSSEDSYPVAPPPSLKERDQVGANDFPLDRDGKIRRTIVYVAEPNGQNIFSFSFKLAYLYLKAQNIPPIQREDLPIQVGNTTAFVVQAGNLFIPRFTTNSGGYMRAEDGGYQTLLNYRGSPQKFKTISIVDVLEEKISLDFIKGKIVLIGATAESSKDLFYTPYSSSLLRSPGRMPGVVIHAHSISQFINAAVENRSFIRTWNEPLEWLWIATWSILGAVLSWQQRYSSSNIKRRIPWTVIGIIVAIISLLLGSYAVLLLGWWIPLVPAGLALVGSAASVTAYVAHSAGEIRKAFGRFVTDEIVANLLEKPEGLKLGGERRKITILTSDIRGFTAISERLSPEEVIRIINLYLGYMADVITQYQGTIDEFMGDGILVLFGAPTKRDDDADRAIGCAIAMQLAMKSVNEKMIELGLPNLEMGIGINTGDVVVGNIGSEKRTKYGVVGDQVNLTYRIESYTVGGQIFVSESTLKQLNCDVVTDEEREVQPKGVHYPIKIYEVIGILGKYNLHLTKTDEVFYNLPIPIDIQYAVLQGKQVDRDLVTAKLIQISAREAEVYLEDAGSLVPPPLTNLKMNLLSFEEDSFDDSDDIYAKVLEKPAGRNRFFIRFTNRPPRIELFFSNLYESLSTDIGIKKEL